MPSHEIVLIFCVALAGMLLGGFIQYSKDMSPKYQCINGALHERVDQSTDVYVTMNTACIKVK